MSRSFGSGTDRINRRLLVTTINLQSSARRSLPAPLRTMPSSTRGQIVFDRADTEASSTITRSDTGESIFTFDLPAELLERYAENWVLTRQAALNLIEGVFGQFTAIYSPQDVIRVFNFILDQ